MRTDFIFFGHDRFSALALAELLKQRLTPSLVVDLPAKPQGRKKIVVPSPVTKLAKTRGLKTVYYKKKNPLDLIPDLKNTNASLGILASFGAIIPQSIIDFFPKGILVVHPSLLPKYRGPSPVRQAILDGVKKTGVTILLMDAKMDHGPVLTKREHPLGPDETREKLLGLLFPLGARLITQIVPDYLNGKIKPVPQNHAQATYTRPAHKNDGRIDWHQTPAAIDRHLRAYAPWPGSWTEVREREQTKRLRVLKGHLEKNQFVLDQVQLEGKKPVSWKQFQEGHPHAIIRQS